MSGLKIADMTAQDTGNQSFKIARAVTEFTANTSRSMVHAESNSYMAWPHEWDIGTAEHVQLGREWLLNVDVVHVHNKYRYSKGWGYINPNAKWLIHMHGRPGRAKWAAVLEADKSRDAHRVVSTLNLLKWVEFDPARWIPAPMRLSWFDGLKKENPRPVEFMHEFWVSHTPTNRKAKGTEAISDAVDSLRKKGYPVRLKLSEYTKHEDAMKVRAQCDVTYDQMHLCYGNSGLEGMAFGQPTLVGPPANVREIIKETIGHEPYVFVSPETLERTLQDLIERPKMRADAGAKCRRYVEGWHCDRIVAQKIAALYEAL